MAPYNAPAPTGAAVNWNNWPCNEKAVHQALGIAYANDCSSWFNVPQGTPIGDRNLYMQKDCVDHNNLAKTHVTGRPPIAPAPRYNLRSHTGRANILVTPRPRLPRYFLTTMCRLCEEREIVLWLQRTGMAMLPQLPTEAARMVNFPRNTCTCQYHLEGQVLCLSHRRARWVNHKNQLNQQRIRNAALLEDMELRPATNTTHHATPATLQRRHANGIWRACRCGRDPIAKQAQADVLQCLACEGVRILGNSRVPVHGLNGFITPAHTYNSSNARAILGFDRNVLP